MKKGDKGWIIEGEEIIGVTVEGVIEIDTLYYTRVQWDTDRNKVTVVRPYHVLASEEEVETEVRRKIANLKRNMMLFKVARERATLPGVHEIPYILIVPKYFEYPLTERDARCIV